VQLFARRDLAALLPLEITYTCNTPPEEQYLSGSFQENIVILFQELEEFGRQLAVEGGVEGRLWPDLRRRTWDFMHSWFNKPDNHPLHTSMKDLDTTKPFVWGEDFEYEEAIKYDGEE
jgi:hypothetical protein